MQVREKTRQEIEQKLSMMSDFLKMEYLENCLKQQSTFDVKRFCHENLSVLYDKRNMFAESAKHMNIAAEISATFKDKMQNYMKEVELWIKSNQYDRVDEAFTKALACGNTKEKEEMKAALKELYFKQAKAFEKAQRNSNAMKVYEKILRMNLANEAEKAEIREKLLSLYQKLGKIREYMMLREK